MLLIKDCILGDTKIKEIRSPVHFAIIDVNSNYKCCICGEKIFNGDIQFDGLLSVIYFHYDCGKNLPILYAYLDALIFEYLIDYERYIFKNKYIQNMFKDVNFSHWNF